MKKKTPRLIGKRRELGAGLTPFQMARLNRSIRECADEKNLISHEEVKRMVAHLLNEGDNETDFLTTEQERDLEESVRESEIEANLISNEEAKKLRKQWLS